MFKISMNRVHDHVRIVEGASHLDLMVDADPRSIMIKLKAAQDALQAVSQATDDHAPGVQQAAKAYAAAIFGPSQAEKMLDFYAGSGSAVISLCTKYLSTRLMKLVKAAQRKLN